jgi:hypothetical protein
MSQERSWHVPDTGAGRRDFRNQARWCDPTRYLSLWSPVFFTSFSVVIVVVPPGVLISSLVVAVECWEQPIQNSPHAEQENRHKRRCLMTISLSIENPCSNESSIPLLANAMPWRLAVNFGRVFTGYRETASRTMTELVDRLTVLTGNWRVIAQPRMSAPSLAGRIATRTRPLLRV